MKFTEITEQEFTDFAKNHPYGSFHQNVSWGHLKEKNGWVMHLVGIKEKDKVIAASLILAKDTPIKKKIFYAPRGFLIDYNDKELLGFFLTNLKLYLKNNKAIFLKFDPYVEYQERDILGNIVENGYNNQSIIDNLTNLNCHHHGFTKYFEDMQPRWIYTLDTKNKTVDEIMQGMDPKTRQILRKNERMGITIEELNESNLDKFHQVMEDTSSRREFADRPLKYYQNMFHEFKKKNEIMVYLATFNHQNYIDFLEDEVSVNEEEIRLREEEYLNNKDKMNRHKVDKKNKINQDNIERLKNNIKTTKESKKLNGNVIELGSILFMKTNNEILSLVGGSYEKYMKFQSAYTTHFAGIKYAIENNYDRYNFYGITGDFSESNPLYGLYSFKRDFGGKVVELIGEFDFIISKPSYLLYNIAFKMYHWLKNR